MEQSKGGDEVPKETRKARRIAERATERFTFGEAEYSRLPWFADWMRRHGDDFALAFYRRTDLSAPLFESLFALVKENMEPIYDEAEQWDDANKRRDMDAPEQRFLVLTDRATSHVAALLMFQFSTDDHPDFDWEVPVGYLYEVQVRAAFQGRGLGAFLVRVADAVGRENKMEKLMLTVYKVNTAAIAFYRRLGFAIDGISPSNYVDDDGNPLDEPYEIMSRPIQRRA
ncbi:hypothetical protein H9P43_007304 [Blastocladiella emersonii ATCC 22665]|nr:hypothetical protein H9P43_007304 [Blastocladiella emersonii ATCC 22665]